MADAGSVAAALIVKNEEKFLPGCLTSLRAVVDEMVVVDTGSTDDTFQIAREAGAKAVRHEWREDFALARNVGLDATACEWILYIDADERLRLPEGGRVIDHLEERAIGAYVRFQPKAGYTRYREARLFRNDPRLRFEGKIHETIMPMLREISVREGRPIIRSTIEIDHLGYDGDQSHKHLRNLPLLKAGVKDNPGRLFYWHHLAETLVALGRKDEAIEAATAGLARVKLDVSEKREANACLILQTLTRLYLERGEDPLPLIDANTHYAEGDYGLLFLRGHALLKAGRPLEALETARRLRQIDPDTLQESLLAFDRRVFRDKACELAALACLAAGLRKEAVAYHVEAARLARAAATP